MSRPWSRSVRLRVEPGMVRGTLMPGWIQTKLLTPTSPAAEVQARRTEFTAARSGPSIEALSHATGIVLTDLGAASSLRGLQLKVELADSLVHLDVVAGEFAGHSDRQLQSVAAACVSELLGDAAEDHETRYQLQADEKHLLICAVARDQLGALSDAAAQHGSTLASVQPDLCMQWNRHATALKPGGSVFAVACGREAVIASVSDGTISALSSGAWLDRQDTTSALDSRVDRLLASVGRDAASQSAFVLVAPAWCEKAVSPRWTVMNQNLQTP